METVLRTHKISKKYNKTIANQNIDITVKQGEIYGLIGKNGAGKTTLLKIISGLTTPSSGSLELFGHSSESELKRMRKRTGCIIEMPCFFSYLSAEKNLEYYRLQRGIPGKSSIQEALDFVGLADTGNKPFRYFSMGMKQRLGMALALLGNPDLLILDEPINGFDPIGIAKFRETIKKLNTERNITVIISSHILGELSQIATTFGFIDKGVLLEEATSKAIEEKCRQCLSISVDDVGKAVTLLESKLRCTEYEVLDDNNMKVYQLLDSSDMLAQTLILDGVKVFSISREETNLEDYFIKMIGGARNA